MYRRHHRSQKILNLIPELRETDTSDQSDQNYKTLRPRLKKPLYTDNSLNDTTITERNRDSTYIPATDDSCANSSSSFINSPQPTCISFIPISERIAQETTPQKTLVSDAIDTNSPPLLDVASNITINELNSDHELVPSLEVKHVNAETISHNQSINDSGSEFDDSDKDATFYLDPHASSSESSDEEDDITEHNNESDQHQPIDTALNDFQEPPSSHKDTETPRDQQQKRTRSKDYCFFCETEVLNFARHIIRNHELEPDVQKILSYPKKSLTRKNLIATLRKKGNYIINVSNCTKPVKKSNLYPHTDYLPCEKCLGFYSRKQLWKHKKKCNPSSNTSNSQTESHNFMLRHIIVDPKLRKEVFPTMRADRISLEAKKDPLICAFGANYLRIHREKHFKNVTSRKMRDLAKLFIEIKKSQPSTKDFMDCLRPQNYDLIVNATKKVAGYDHQKDCYSAPTYAMNISTSIKQCCNIAIMTTLKAGRSVANATMEADLKTLIQLIEGNWKFDVSSQANSDLNLKKWNKITIVPLASDLKLLKDYLCAESARATELLKSGTSNVEAYITLTETIYCRIILLNRRRPGELQRLLLSTYNQCNNDTSAYEEFDRAISTAEKLLVKSFKRIIIRGKRGRGVPVLITEDVQRDIDLLISARHKYITDSNKFLFAKPGYETSLCGYKVLEKYSKLSGAKNPKAITTTKLRKHLATLTQMFNMKDTDIEQLANFMGHTQSVHRQNYRLPDDIYQTAKISKLLLLMEGGNADKYKGKALDDIDLDLEQDLLTNVEQGDDDEEDDINYDEIEQNDENAPNDLIAENNIELRDVTNRAETGKKKKRNLVPWTSQQKKIVTKYFEKHIKLKKPPKRHECEELRDQHPDVLHNKDWLKIKVFIQNTYKKN